MTEESKPADASFNISYEEECVYEEEAIREYEDFMTTRSAIDIMFAQRFLAPFYGRVLPTLDDDNGKKELRWYDAIELLVREFDLDLYEALYSLRQDQLEDYKPLTVRAVRALGRLVTDPRLRKPDIIGVIKHRSWFPELVRDSALAGCPGAAKPEPTETGGSDTPTDAAASDEPTAGNERSGADD